MTKAPDTVIGTRGLYFCLRLYLHNQSHTAAGRHNRTMVREYPHERTGGAFPHERTDAKPVPDPYNQPTERRMMSDTGEFITQNVSEDATTIAFREMERQLTAWEHRYTDLIIAVHSGYHLHDRSRSWKGCKTAICQLAQMKLGIEHEEGSHEEEANYEPKSTKSTPIR